MARFGRQAIHLVAVSTLGMSMAAVSQAAQAAPPGRAAPATGRAGPAESPNPSSTYNQLNGVNADSATDAWAVGYYLDSTRVPQPLILHWDGTAWSQVTSPTPQGFSTLSAVSALSPTDVWAVGSIFTQANVQRPLIIHWNGTAWSQVKSPSQGAGQNPLLGVSAVSATSAWATGEYTTSTGATRDVILHWNGAAWSRVKSPEPGSDSVLLSVSAKPGAGAWAVGSWRRTARSLVKSLTVHWNGRAWSKVNSPSSAPAGAGFASLRAVSSVSPAAAFAAGSILPNQLRSTIKTLVMNWDGRSWSKQPGASLSRANNELDGVSADSATDAWAVGWARDLDKFETYHSVTLHWDGTSWSLVPNPDPFGGDGGTSQLFAVSAVSPADAWAVGTCTCLGTDTNQTLILHWDGTAWTQV
jgi:hypothetical protein